MWESSSSLQQFKKHGFGICCFMAGSGSLFCTYLGFPTPNPHHRCLFRLSGVGFFTFTVVGYLYGPDSKSFLKRLSFRLALSCSSAGLGMCAALWRWSDVLIVLLSVATALFQLTCAHFQLDGSFAFTHFLITLLSASLGALLRTCNVIGGEDVTKAIEQMMNTSRRLESDNFDDDGSWALKLIIACVSIIVGTGFVAGGKFVLMRFRQKTNIEDLGRDSTVESAPGPFSPVALTMGNRVGDSRIGSSDDSTSKASSQNHRTEDLQDKTLPNSELAAVAEDAPVEELQINSQTVRPQDIFLNPGDQAVDPDVVDLDLPGVCCQVTLDSELVTSIADTNDNYQHHVALRSATTGNHDEASDSSRPGSAVQERMLEPSPHGAQDDLRDAHPFTVHVHIRDADSPLEFRCSFEIVTVGCVIERVANVKYVTPNRVRLFLCSRLLSSVTWLVDLQQEAGHSNILHLSAEILPSRHDARITTPTRPASMEEIDIEPPTFASEYSRQTCESQTDDMYARRPTFTFEEWQQACEPQSGDERPTFTPEQPRQTCESQMENMYVRRPTLGKPPRVP